MPPRKSSMFKKSQEALNCSSDCDSNAKQEGTPSKQGVEEDHVLCEYHEGKTIEMYCKQHDEVCCNVCISVDHRFCSKVDYIPNIAGQLLHREIGVKYDLLDVSRDLRELKSKQVAFRNDIVQKQDTITTEIQQFKAKLFEKVEKLEKASILEVERRCKLVRAALERDINRVDKMLLDVETDLSKVEQKVHGNTAELFVNAKMAKRHMSQRIDYRTELFGTPYERIDFNIHPNLKDYFVSYENLGTLMINRRPLTPFVNVIVPINTAATDSLKNTLQADLKEVGIRSKFINTFQFQPDVYTIIMITCMNDVRHLCIERKHHRNLILLRLDDTPPGGRSFLDKLNDYMVVPSGEDIFNFLNWADVALKLSIPFTRNPTVRFNRSDKVSAFKQIAELIQ